MLEEWKLLSAKRAIMDSLTVSNESETILTSRKKVQICVPKIRISRHALGRLITCLVKVINSAIILLFEQSSTNSISPLTVVHLFKMWDYQILFRIAYLLFLIHAIVKGSSCYSSGACPPSEPKYGYPVTARTGNYGATPVPVAFDTSTAYPVCLQNVKIEINGEALLLVKNDGVQVSFYPYNASQKIATATGGPVFNYTYTFYDASYVVDGVAVNARCADTLNGFGFPFKFWTFFIKDEYGTEEIATQRRDGFLKFNCPGIVDGRVKNPSFTQIQRALSKVRFANATTTIKAKYVLPFILEPLLSCETYYSYPGAYIVGGVKYTYSAIDIYPPFNRLQYLSFDQFEIFQNIFDKNNQPEYDNLVAVRPQYPRPLIQVQDSKVYFNYRSNL